jgi:hypothetical protein
MNIKFNEDTLDRYNRALERALDCPFIQEDDELYDDLVSLQEVINHCV